MVSIYLSQKYNLQVWGISKPFIHFKISNLANFIYIPIRLLMSGG